MISRLRPPTRDDDRAKQDLYGKLNEVIDSVNIGTEKVQAKDSGAEKIGSTRIVEGTLGDLNYEVKTEKGYKPISFDRTYWGDLRTPVSSAKAGGGVGGADEVFWDVDGGTTFRWLAFDLDEYSYFTIEVPPDWIQGTSIHSHIHYTIPDNGAGIGAENVKWILDYSWVNAGVAFPTPAAITSTRDVQDDTLGDHIHEDIGWLDGSGKTVGSMIKCRLERDTAGNDYGSDAYLIAIDFAYQTDGKGGRAEDVK